MQRKLTLTLSILAFVLIPIAVLAPRGLTVVLGLMAFVSYVALWRDRDMCPAVRRHPITLCLGLLVVLVLASALWSVDPALSLERSVSVVGIAVAVTLLLTTISAAPQKIESICSTPLIAGALLGLALMGIEIMTDAAISRWARQDNLLQLPPLSNPDWGRRPLNTAMSALAVLAWPVLIVAWRRHRLLAAGLGAGTVVILAGSHSEAPLVAFAVGTLAAIFVWRLPKRAYLVIGAFLAVAVVASPLLVKALPDPKTATMDYTFLPSSTVHRLMIWNTTTDHISERPWLGFGLEASRTFSSKDDAENTVLMRMPDGRLFRARSESIPLHPHNAMLQWWLELGVLGALLGAAFAGYVVAAGRNLSSGDAAMSFGLTITVLFIMATSYGAWQSWWLSVSALAGLLTFAFIKRPAIDRPDGV